MRDERDFGVRESGLEPAEGQSMKVIGFTGLLKSLTYILLCGVRPSVGGGFGPLGTPWGVPVLREFFWGLV